MATDVRRSVTIIKPRAEVYCLWRRFENLPRFMDHLQAVTEAGDGTSPWVAKAPAGREVAWDAEIVVHRPNELISWRSRPGADVANGGEVRFADAPAGRGTEVRVTLGYDPPAGAVGAALAKVFGEEPDQQVREDLRRFKQVMEAGEIPTTEGQPSGRTPRQPDTDERTARAVPPDHVVEEASEGSFPASDPPAYATGRRHEHDRPAPS